MVPRARIAPIHAVFRKINNTAAISSTMPEAMRPHGSIPTFSKMYTLSSEAVNLKYKVCAKMAAMMMRTKKLKLRMLFMIPKIIINTSRLLIRDMRMDDLDDFQAYRSMPDIAVYQDFDVMNKQEAAAFISQHIEQPDHEHGQWKQYAIELRQSGKLIGDCGIMIDDEHKFAHIGITISIAAQRNGYAGEALHALMTYLFDTLQMHRIVEIVDTRNTASIQLLKRSGFRQEGHFIENVFSKGSWCSEYQYAMLRREWDALHHS
jgi:ribosomal-protein-alanine N-acetyltransferase